MNFILSEHNSIKVSFDRNTQNLHQLTNTTSTNPTDLWIPTSKLVKPEISDQVATGWFGNFLHGGLQPSVEVYYKYMQNQIDYRSGADLILNQYVESQLVFGNGWSYGVETMIKYDIWKFHGWVAYDWSRSQGKFPGIDGGVPFYFKQDRTHEVDIVAMCCAVTMCGSSMRRVLVPIRGLHAMHGASYCRLCWLLCFMLVTMRG